MAAAATKATALPPDCVCAFSIGDLIASSWWKKVRQEGVGEIK
jgi:hypothetical protein